MSIPASNTFTVKNSAGYGEFAQFRDKDKYPEQKDGWDAAYAKRDALRDDVLLKSDIVALGYGLQVPEYKRVRATHPDAKRYMGEDAFEYLLQLCLTETIKKIEVFDSKAKVFFVGDLDESKSERYLEVYKAWTKANPTISKRSIGMAFHPDEHWPGLQASDMVATVVKKVFDETKTTGIPVIHHPLAGKMLMIGNVTEDYFLGVLEVQKKPHRIEG